MKTVDRILAHFCQGVHVVLWALGIKCSGCRYLTERHPRGSCPGYYRCMLNERLVDPHRTICSHFERR